MIIDSSAISMNSARRYTARRTNERGLVTEDNKNQQNTTSGFMNLLGRMNVTNQENNSFSSWNYRLNGNNVEKIDDMQMSLRNENRIRFQTMSYLLHILFYKQQGGFRGNMISLSDEFPEVYSSNQLQMIEHSTYEETEDTYFSTTGKVITGDGREIEFNIELGMSRSFYEEYNSITSYTIPQTVDPLVINLESGAANVTDQKFYFDLDCDGTKEEISQLGQGSGFLALDKDGNGKIDDGSELFGTKSGDGFYDLSMYDDDGNGWIDEADEIFDKLRIWSMDSEGNSRLYTLKQSGVGAICLAHVKTEHSLNTWNNDTNAIIRQSGIFLREDGSAGTIQHVDMAM